MLTLGTVGYALPVMPMFAQGLFALVHDVAGLCIDDGFKVSVVFSINDPNFAHPAAVIPL